VYSDRLRRRLARLREEWEAATRASYIDLHAHILPGLDDGPQDLEAALEMAREAQEEGVRVIVASPHTMNGVYEVSREEVLEATKDLQQEVDKAELDLLLVPATELHLSADPLEILNNGGAMAVGDGNHVIIELPASQVPPFTADMLFRLQLGGFTPIINHPERNTQIQRRPSELSSLLQAGALAMLTASSIAGDFGDAIQRTARQLLQKGSYAFMVSDAHGFGTRRFSCLSRGIAAASRVIGREAAVALVTTRPAEVLESSST